MAEITRCRMVDECAGRGPMGVVAIEARVRRSSTVRHSSLVSHRPQRDHRRDAGRNRGADGAGNALLALPRRETRAVEPCGPMRHRRFGSGEQRFEGPVTTSTRSSNERDERVRG